MTQEEMELVSTDSFGVVLKVWRASKGLTAKTLAELYGCSPAYICSLEKGNRKPSYETVIKLADVLGCEIVFTATGCTFQDVTKLGEDDPIDGPFDVDLNKIP